MQKRGSMVAHTTARRVVISCAEIPSDMVSSDEKKGSRLTPVFLPVDGQVVDFLHFANLLPAILGADAPGPKFSNQELFVLKHVAS